jgi:hypothetical protein
MRFPSDALIRRILSVCARLSWPHCVPIAALLAIIGAAIVACGWWWALPAHLPGDEYYVAGRVGELTLRTLAGQHQAPDAPPPAMAGALGVFALVTALAVVAIGLTLWAMRRRWQLPLARWAHTIRLVVTDEKDVGWDAPVAMTVVHLMADEHVGWRRDSLALPIGDQALALELPRLAARVCELFALSRDARANLQLTRRVLECRAQRPGPAIQRLRLRLDSPMLRAAIGKEAEFARSALDARLISYPEILSRRLLRTQPPNKVRIAGMHGRPALVIIGLGDAGLEFFPRLSAQAQSAHIERPVIVLVDTSAASIAHQITQAWPALALTIELRALNLDAHLPLSSGRLLSELRDQSLVPTFVYLALDNRELVETWRRELDFSARSAGEGSPLVLALSGSGGMEIDAPMLAQEDALAALSRHLHESFLRDSTAGHRGAASVPWAELPFEYQESNRSAADHFWVKALDLDVRIVESRNAQQLPPIDGNRLEISATAEHRRWCADRALYGWRVGPERAEARHVNPSLVNWASLSETERERDRDVLRGMPAALEAGGFALQSMPTVALPCDAGQYQRPELLLPIARAAAAGWSAGGPVHVVVPVVDGASFLLAERLSPLPDVVVSLILAQPLSGLALAAGRAAAAASALAESAFSIWITSAESIPVLLRRWRICPTPDLQ